MELKNLLILVAFCTCAIIIFCIHMFLLYKNSYLYNIFVSFYIIIFCVIIIIIISKKKDCISTFNYNVLINLSIYTVFLQLIIISIIIYFWAIKKDFMFSESKSNYNTSSRYNNNNNEY